MQTSELNAFVTFISLWSKFSSYCVDVFTVTEINQRSFQALACHLCYFPI